MEKVRGDIVGGYMVERRLGPVSGQAAVYLAKSPEGTRVVIKVPNSTTEDARRRFLHERNCLRLCRHKNIVRCLRESLVPGAEYIVLTYADGGDLKTWLEEPKEIDWSVLDSIFKPIAAALDHFRDLTPPGAQPFQHRDVKPENILFHEGNPLLIDFGIAYQDGNLTMAGEFVGSREHISPEQLQDLHSNAIDQYALASVIYRWLARESAFPIPKYKEKIKTNPSRAPLDRCKLGIQVQLALLKGMAIDPAQRYPSCVTMVDSLIAATRQPSGDPTQPGPKLDHATEADPFSRFKNADEVYDSLAARLVQCRFEGRWVEDFKQNLAAQDTFDSLQGTIDVAALSKWLRSAPAHQMRTLFMAIKEVPAFNDAEATKIILLLLIFASCRVLNLGLFLSSTRRGSADPRFKGAGVRQWPTSSASVAGVASAALAGRMIVVGPHAATAGALVFEMRKLCGIEGRREFIMEMCRQLDLGYDDQSLAWQRLCTASAPDWHLNQMCIDIREALARRAHRRESLTIVIKPDPDPSISPAEREAITDNLAAVVEFTLFEMSAKPPQTLARTEADLEKDILDVLLSLQQTQA